MGEVYLCTNLELGNKWAVKIVRNDSKNSNIAINEENTLKMLNHRNMPQIVDILRDREYTYIVETYIEGKSLNNFLIMYEGMAEQQTIDLALQLCDALHYLHNFQPKPIIYRDMKPSNIMLTKDGKAVLIDFGAAAIYSKNAPDQFIIGTNAYSAPEQLIIGGVSDMRTDIYGLGATMYHMATGELHGKRLTDHEETNNHISKELLMIIERCLQKDKENRFSSIDELREALKKLHNKNISESISDESKIKPLIIMIGIASALTYIGVLVSLLCN